METGDLSTSTKSATALLHAGLVILAHGLTLQAVQAREVSLPPALVIGEPTAVIYRSVSAEGSVTFSDQPAAPVSAAARKAASQPVTVQDVIRVTGNRAEQEARARAEREYWRKQADAFAARQRDRDREVELQRRERIAAAERETRALIVPGVVVRGGPWWFNGQPGVGNNPSLGTVGNGAGAYTSSPGAASAAGPANFIGSGFASSNSGAVSR